ncbi:FAD dependent oxidoreductase [Agrocybe pediades]|nr:FAD dependent oxidoreductase [Agrocybe pediades]
MTSTLSAFPSKHPQRPPSYSIKLTNIHIQTNIKQLGGIIGCTTAYYLTQHPKVISGDAEITLIEASVKGPAQGASGKAGGLVARWAYPKEIVDVSFDEHVKLAEAHGGKDRWGWRFVGCGSWEGHEGGSGNKSLEKEPGLPGAQKPRKGTKAEGKSRKDVGLPDNLLWVDEALTDSYSPMARKGDTAQVHPYQFTTSMFELAKSSGLNYIHGKVTSILKEGGKVTGVQYTDPNTNTSQIKHATHVLLCAGAWSLNIVSELPISATRAHSIAIRPNPTAHSSPEIYARPDNEVYACGPGDDYPSPATVDEVVVDAKSCDLIHKHVSSISKELREGTVEKRQACYLPSVTIGGGPIIGEASMIAKGLYIGTGHTC